jgi:hypothetical protein
VWAWSRWRGRRDFLLLRLDLQRAPAFRADLVARRAWTARDRRADEAPLRREQTWTDGAGSDVDVRDDGGAEVRELRTFWDRLDRLSGGVWRISVRPLVPHLEIHLLPPRLETTESRQLLGAVRELAEVVAAPR